MIVKLSPIWYGQDLFMQGMQPAGVVVRSEDWEERVYAVAWLETTPDGVRECVVRAVEGLWTSERTIFHEVTSSLASRGIAIGDAVEEESSDLQVLADRELLRLAARPS